MDDLRPGDFLYVHPGLAGLATIPSYAESLVAREIAVPAGPDFAPAPPWVTRTRRYLDEAVAQMFPGRAAHDLAEQSPLADGVRAAVRFVGGVMRESGQTRAAGDVTRLTGGTPAPPGPAGPRSADDVRPGP